MQRRWSRSFSSWSISSSRDMDASETRTTATTGEFVDRLHLCHCELRRGDLNPVNVAGLQTRSLSDRSMHQRNQRRRSSLEELKELQHCTVLSSEELEQHTVRPSHAMIDKAD